MLCDCAMPATSLIVSNMSIFPMARACSGEQARSARVSVRALGVPASQGLWVGGLKAQKQLELSACLVLVPHRQITANEHLPYLPLEGVQSDGPLAFIHGPAP